MGLRTRFLRVPALAAGLLTAAAVSAAEPFVVEIIRPAPLAKPVLFDQTVLWIAESFQSARAVIELKDKEMGVVIGNAASEVDVGFVSFLPAMLPIKFKMRIDVRDNRYRLTFSNVIVGGQGGDMPIENTHRETMDPKVRQLFVKLADSLDSYIAKSPKDF